MPEKSRLTWRIGGLRLDPSRGAWLATGFKRDRVSVIVLPHLHEAVSEDAWLENIEAAFEAASWDPLADLEPDSDSAAASGVVPTKPPTAQN
jgi:hypothetical protein